ncbi:MAG: LamG-like jellyroll fold domain-containing protein [Verrucomicrobiota bacterium]
MSSGGGPGSSPGTVLELDAVSGGQSALAWSLQISADGNTLGLFAETGSGLQQVLQTPIAWMAGQPHCLALVDDAAGTTLYVDGSMAAQGAGLPSIPLSAGQLVIGSTLAGGNPAGADFDEFCSFNRLLTAFDVGMYYQWYSGLAALGPISDEQQAAWNQRRAGLAQNSILSPGNVYDANNATPCSPGGPFYITNVGVALQTNGLTAVSFDIFGGTNGVFMDIFRMGDLNDSPPPIRTWIGQGMTCSTYCFINQPADQAFYELELPAETMTVAWGDNTYGQCEVPFGLSNAIAVAAGGYFSLALLNNGTVMGWGDNQYGQTNIPAGLTNVVGIAAGLYHGVAVLADGSVTNWGYYSDGYDYYSSVTNRAYASAPPTSGVVAVAAGMGQDLALLTNGTCVAWGFTNVYGTGAAFGTRVPPGLTNVSAIACGWQFNLALSSNGAVTAWGCGDCGFGYPTTLPSDLSNNVVAIAAGGNNAMALRNDGTVEGWGDPYSGVTNVPYGLSNVVSVATGGNSGLALRANGTVVAWGDYLEEDDSLTNEPAGMVGVKAISAGLEHNLVIESGQLNPIILEQPTDNYVFTGGSATFSVTGEGVSPITYQWQFNGTNIGGATNSTFTLTNAQSTNQGSYDVIISTPFGSITSAPATFELLQPPQIVSLSPPTPGTNWINSTNFAVSVMATNADEYDYPITYQWSLNGTNEPRATNISFVVNLSSGQNETAAVRITDVAGTTNVSWTFVLAQPGMVEAWGDDAYGQCDRPASLTNIAGIAAGFLQSVAVTDGGTVVQWGTYSDGSPVTGTNVSQPPTNGVVAVAAGWGQAMALMTNGQVVAWGENGDPGTDVPPNLTGVKAIACGFDFSVALLTNGTVTAWGTDLLGVTNVPSNLTNVTAIAAGVWHTLAISNGCVVGWGNDGFGQTDVPTGLSNVVAVAAGGFFSLALTSDGHVAAWGDNSYGQTKPMFLRV